MESCVEKGECLELVRCARVCGAARGEGRRERAFTSDPRGGRRSRSVSRVKVARHVTRGLLPPAPAPRPAPATPSRLQSRSKCLFIYLLAIVPT
ncbi:hypothetical protein JYU34_010843 [Plutella xylostella]|uniref:Uncharacterized protein n=1 Tax=Plutella xylostella TaxID=51655 RepID=A0ABQ7QFD6_PLUXY|nr:hypothetical protein JYU34_010843 [Plutella xylostella]